MYRIHYTVLAKWFVFLFEILSIDDEYFFIDLCDGEDIFYILPFKQFSAESRRLEDWKIFEKNKIAFRVEKWIHCTVKKIKFKIFHRVFFPGKRRRGRKIDRIYYYFPFDFPRAEDRNFHDKGFRFFHKLGSAIERGNSSFHFLFDKKMSLIIMLIFSKRTFSKFKDSTAPYYVTP